MAWQNDEEKKLATDMLKKSRGYKEILDAVANRCKMSDLYCLKKILKDAGELPGEHRQSSQKGKSTKRKSNKGNGLDKEIEQEIARLKAENDKYEELIDQYDNKSTEFVCYVETKLEGNKKKLRLLEEIAAL